MHTEPLLDIEYLVTQLNYSCFTRHDLAPLVIRTAIAFGDAIASLTDDPLAKRNVQSETEVMSKDIGENGLAGQLLFLLSHLGPANTLQALNTQLKTALSPTPCPLAA